MIPGRLLVLLSTIPIALSIGWVFASGLLPVIAAVDGVLVAAALMDGLRSGATVRLRREHGPLASVGAPFEVTVVVENLGPRTLTVQVDDAVALPSAGLPREVEVPAGQSVRVPYTITPTLRGHVHFGALTARWRSPLGLWWRQRRSTPEDAGIRVYPDFGHLRDELLRARHDERRMPVRARRRPGGESEFERLRTYVPGDPYRHIDWKATARRQRFITREFGQEVNQNVVFMIDAGRSMSASFGQLTAFDLALNAALAMGHAALRRGDRVGMIVFDREVRAWLPLRGGTRSGARLVLGTYDVFPSLHEPDPGVAFRHLSSVVRRRSLVVYLTAATDQVNADGITALAGALAGRHLPLCVWLRDPSVDALLTTPAHDTSALYRRAAAAELDRWRMDALAEVRHRGALVVDCPPADLSARLLDSYLEIKARRLL